MKLMNRAAKILGLPMDFDNDNEDSIDKNNKTLINVLSFFHIHDYH
jgi:hypothetical protein